MPLPWKKARSGRISRLVADLQQSPKHGGSLVVETGFPTSLIDLFVKNRDRLKKPSSKIRRSSSSVNISPSTPQRSSPPPPLTRRSSFPPPRPLPTPREEPVEREAVASNKIEEHVSGENTPVDGDGAGACVLMVVLVKVFVVAVLALSTKKLTVGITVSAFALLFLEFAVARVFACLKLCPNARSHLDSFFKKILGKQRKEKSVGIDAKNVTSCEITETFEDSRDCMEGTGVPESCKNTVPRSEPESVVLGEKNPVDSSMDTKREKANAEPEVQTIRDLVFKKERSKSSKLKSKIVKKIVPKKLRNSMKKRKSMKNKEEKDREGEGEEEEEEEEDEEGSLTEVSSFVSDDKSERIGSEISSEMGCDDLNPPLLEDCREVEENRDGSSKGNKNQTNMMIVLFVIVLVGLLGGKALAIGLFLLWCLVLRFAGKSNKLSEKPV